MKHLWLEYVACQIGQFLTRKTGIQVSFGSAEPNWKDGKLSFKNVKVYCGPPNEGQFGNYTQYDLTIDSFDVNISLARMLEGKGLAKNCSVSGVRGTIDRSYLQSIPGWRYKPQPGDFELENVSIKDLLINVVSGQTFRPYTFSVLSAELPRLRKIYLLYDILSTNSAVGMFDKCLFSVHTPQIEIQEGDNRIRANYSKIRHLKIDGLNVDHFGTGTAASGPLSWLQRGMVDIDAFVQLPSNHREPSEDGVVGALENIRENILLAVLKNSNILRVTVPESNKTVEEESMKLTKIEEKLRDLRLTYLTPTMERLRRRIYYRVHGLIMCLL